ARRVDVEVDVLVRIVRLQVEHLGDHEIRQLVFDEGQQEDDALLEETREDVERPLAARSLLDDHRNQSHRGSPLLRLASDGGAPAPRRPAARTAITRSVHALTFALATSSSRVMRSRRPWRSPSRSPLFSIIRLTAGAGR